MKNFLLLTLVLLSSILPSGANDATKSFKRGFGENTLYYTEDLQALLPGNSWFYNWGDTPAPQVAGLVGTEKGLTFIPQAWNGNFNLAKLKAYYATHPGDRYLLGFNEPNFPDQANMLPSEAAEKWRELESFAKENNLILVGPAMNYAGQPLKDGKVWGPYDWMDAFIAAYKEKYGTEPHFDYTAVHAYMDNADAMMTIVDGFAKKYGKQVWLTEFCAWEDKNLTAETQQEYMLGKLKALELSDNVYRYAWFKARNANKYPYYHLLYYPTKKIAKGTLTDLGFAYIHMSTFNREKYYGINEAIPANGFVDCNLSRIQQSADPRALDITELYLNKNNLSATYQVNVPEAGTYKLIIRYAREKDDLTARINILDANNGVLANRITLEPTAGWTNYVAKAIDVTLPAGKQILTIKKASFAPLALSLVKLVKEVTAGDEDMKTLTGKPISKPETGDDNGGDTPVTPGENESFDKEVAVSDDAFKFDANHRYYTIYLDGTTQKANISDDRFVNIGDNGTSQNSYLWENSFSYGDATGKNSFGVEGDYKALVVADKGWSGMGYNINSTKGDLDLSGINKDYKLHLALKASHNYPINIFITDGSGHTANLVFGRYDMDGKDPVADFKRDGNWHNVDIPVAYLTKKFGIDFSKDTDYNGNLLCCTAGGTQGVQVNFDAVFFYGPKDSKPDANIETGLSRFKATVGDTPFKFSDNEKYYIIYLDAATKGQNLTETQIVDCGPNGSSHNLYPWDNTCTANAPEDNNSFGEPGVYMSWEQTGGWFGLGYNIAGSTSPLNLSGINDDYFLHFAVKTTYAGPILFSVTDVHGKSGNIVLGKEKYHDHAPLCDFERNGKWHHIEVPVHLLNTNDGLNFTRSTNYTGNIFSIIMAGQPGTVIDYDAVFFHGPKDAPAYPDETVENKDITITKASESPFEFSSQATYYIIALDNDTKKKNLADEQIMDIGPNESTRFLYPWEDTVQAQAAMGKNSFGVEGGYTSWKTIEQSPGWSGLGFAINRNGLTNLSGIGKDYALHFAVKSTTDQSIDFIITDGNKKAAHIVLGKEKYGDYAPVGDFERDNNWYNVEVPMAYLIRQGLDFRTAQAYEGNIFAVLCGTKGNLVVDYDAVFFYGPKGNTTGINREDAPKAVKDNKNIPTEIFDMQGRKVQDMAAPGIYIIRSAEGVRKVLKR